MCALPTRVDARRSDYVGAERCRDCHQDIYRSWAKSSHARAGSSLADSVGLRRCQTCHTTGDAPTGRGYFDGVECEACHGAGAAYSPEDVMRDGPLSRALGLRDLSSPDRRAALCGSCHRAETGLIPFDAEEAWKRIAHP